VIVACFFFCIIIGMHGGDRPVASFLKSACHCWYLSRDDCCMIVFCIMGMHGGERPVASSRGVTSSRGVKVKVLMGAAWVWAGIFKDSRQAKGI